MNLNKETWFDIWLNSDVVGKRNNGLFANLENLVLSDIQQLWYGKCDLGIGAKLDNSVK